MWGFGGKYYWGRKERGRKIGGIVLIFAWMSSEERHVKNYVDLYSSLGWNSIVCHSQFLNSFFPEKARLLALDVLNELVQELNVRPCPVVFASFSGGPKACMYKVLQIIDSKCGGQNNMDDYRIVRHCVAGYIYDSCPVDFTSDLGTRFVLHPSVLKMSHPPRLAVLLANGMASGLDTLFLSRFESQRAEYWQTLYASVSMGAPYLILCSEDDDLAPLQTICNFAQRIQELGGDVRLVKWSSSPHVGHYRLHPVAYKAAVTELLGKASALYSQRIQQLDGEKMGLDGTHDEILGPLGCMRKAAASSSDGSQRFSVGLGYNSLAPNSLECHEGRGVGSFQEEGKSGLIDLPNPPSINAHGVLGQILFDVCVPEDVEGWDITPSSPSSGLPLCPTRRHAHFNPIRCIRRARL
ncbi:hypothetical protein Nepgr_005885 [Nepenthes gracilis]|uniref:DUF829 domain-containing protein n=1 Tax=Nepenthes gracilis TaxID=150966 RepID=A0AAD3S458_NEPGR|nr:hypothetical protein Nepgr_005885 [Nepenthes gracilis]